MTKKGTFVSYFVELCISAVQEWSLIPRTVVPIVRIVPMA